MARIDRGAGPGGPGVRILAAVLTLTGLVLAIGGVRLPSPGGSPYGLPVFTAGLSIFIAAADGDLIRAMPPRALPPR